MPAAIGVVTADPTRTVVGLSGDYDFQFLIEELAVGAQFKLPYLHVVVNNSYLGLIRPAPRNLYMGYLVQLAFANTNPPRPEGYSVGRVAAGERPGGPASRGSSAHE